jgi:hypothetical protein
MSTPAKQANISERTLRSAAEKVLIRGCLLPQSMGDVYSAIAAELGVESAAISGDADARALVWSICKQRTARLDAAVPFYPGEELSFDPQRLALPFHPFATFCRWGCGRQPCMQLKDEALEAALAAARAAAAEWQPPTPAPEMILPPERWAQSLDDSGVLRTLLTAPQDVRLADVLPGACEDEDGDVSWFYYLYYSHAYSLLKHAERYAKAKLVEGYGDKSAIMYTWLYHLSGGVEQNEEARASWDEEREAVREEYDLGPFEPYYPPPTRTPTTHTKAWFVRLERIAAKHREQVNSARRSRSQNEKRHRSDEVERLSKELRWHELSADEIFGGAADLGENGPKGPMFAGMPAYEYHAQKDASRKRVRAAFTSGELKYPTGVF